jgi:hypothetical protein
MLTAVHGKAKAKAGRDETRLRRGQPRWPSVRWTIGELRWYAIGGVLGIALGSLALVLPGLL